jgi:hypothetical protein
MRFWFLPNILRCVKIAGGSQAMDEIVRMAVPESSPADAKQWIGRILIGVVLGEAIWGFLVSITTNLALPAMARVMGGDPQSPLYLGRGDFNVPALFSSVLELCFAGIVAVLLNSWSQKRGRVVSSPARMAPVAPPVQPQVARRPADSPEVPAADTALQAKTAVTSVQPAPQPAQPSAPVAKPAKPKHPKEVYYNIVGEPVEPDDE